MGIQKFNLIVSFFMISMLGASSVLLGQRIFDLDKVWADMRILGDNHYELCGRAIAQGDINGDGYMDVIISAPVTDKVYVIFGSSIPIQTINLNSQSADITILGDDIYSRSIASGDINGDGYDDIIIGAPYAGIGEHESAGKTYVVFGSSFPSPPYTMDLIIQASDITIYGDDAYDYSGYAVGSGDVNNDGYADIIIGAACDFISGPEYDGKTYVLFGSSSPPIIIDLSTQPADITVFGHDVYDWRGQAVASGDINGDGYDDLIIGYPYAVTYGSSNAGKTYVIFGNSFLSPPYTIDLHIQSADITICGGNDEDCAGYAVASEDINNDGFDDIIIGAPYADPLGRDVAGKTYVIFGESFTSLPYTIDLETQPADITIYGDNTIDYSGWAVASGDVNGDGYHDIIIGAYGADPGGRSKSGKTYVIFGESFLSPPYTIDLNTQSVDITICGDDIEDYSGWAVASGDVNGDGYHDIIIGAYGADPGGRSKAGETYVIFGGGPVVTAQGFGGHSWIKEFDNYGNYIRRFKAFGSTNTQGEVHLAVGDIDDDVHDEIAAGHGEGGSSWVKLFELSGSLIRTFKAFGAANSGGEVNLAIGNLDSTPGAKQIAVAHGEGGKSWVKLFKADGSLIWNFKAFGDANAQGEVHLVAGDLNNDGTDEIIAGTGESGSSRVKIFNFWGTLLRSFQTFDSTENPGGEVHLAVGNFDADDDLEIAVSTGYNGSNKVKLFEKHGALINEFTVFWYGGNTNGEVHITAADLNNDGLDEIICGHGEGGSSSVWVCKVDGTRILGFKAFGTGNPQGEVHLAKSEY